MAKEQNLWGKIIKKLREKHKAAEPTAEDKDKGSAKQTPYNFKKTYLSCYFSFPAPHILNFHTLLMVLIYIFPVLNFISFY